MDNAAAAVGSKRPRRSIATYNVEYSMSEEDSEDSKKVSVSLA